MGYDTKFKGILRFTSELTDNQLFKLKTYLGEDCRNHPEWNTINLTYIDLKLSNDNSGLEWNGYQKTYDLDYKIDFVISEMKQSYRDFGLTGELLAQGENIDDRYILKIVDDKIVKERIS